MFRKMKLVRTCRNLIECDLLKILLQSNGIECRIQNEHFTQSEGGSPPIGVAFQSWFPRIWVEDKHYEEAEKLISKNETERKKE